MAAPPIAPHAAHTSPPSPIFSREFPCIHCAYDLRSIPLADRCPECGKPAADSLNSLAAANPDDLASIRRGLIFLVVAGLGFPLLALLLVLAIAFGGGMRGDPEGIFFFIGFLIFACGPISGAIGTGLTTTTIRRAPIPAAFAAFSAPPPQPMPRRLLLGAHCILSILLGMLILGLTSSRGGGEEQLIFVIAMLGGLTLLAWDYRNLILCRTIAALCARTNLPGTRRIFQILAVITLCFAVTHAIAALIALTAYFNTHWLDRLFSGNRPGPIFMTIYTIITIIGSIVQFATLGWMLLWPIMLIITTRRLARPLALATSSRGDFLAMPTNPDAEFITPAAPTA